MLTSNINEELKKISDAQIEEIKNNAAQMRQHALLKEKEEEELVKVLKSPDVVEALNSHGLTPQPSTRDELAQVMARETTTWGRIIRDRKITMD